MAVWVVVDGAEGVGRWGVNGQNVLYGFAWGGVGSVHA